MHAFLAEQESRYGKALAQLDVQGQTAAGNGYAACISGVVVSEREAERLKAFFADRGVQAVYQLKLLSDRTERLEKGWGIVQAGRASREAIDVLNKPYGMIPDAKAREAARATQLLPGEIVRVLGKAEASLLVQKYDETIGWVSEGTVDMLPQEAWDAAHQRWDAVQHVHAEQTYAGDPLKLLQAATALLNVPYQWGGITPAGVDCSGFVQYAYWKSHTLLLPKWSQHQIRCGVACDFLDTAPGDLIFVDQQKTGMHHVVIALDAERCIHASRRLQRVVIWHFTTLFRVYTLREVRRVLSETG